MTKEPVVKYDHLLLFFFFLKGFDYDDCAQVEATQALNLVCVFANCGHPLLG